MKNQITTLENYKLVDLCKKGGLQDVYNLAVEAASEVCDLSTTTGRKRQKSLAAKVSSSKVLFEKACISFLQDEELRTKEGRAEVKAFTKDMDKLRDSTKEQVLAIEAREKAELEAYEIAGQIVLDAEKAVQKAKHAEQALLFAHMEGKEQNMEFDQLETEQDRAKMHCENKGQVFDLALWEASIIIEETEKAWVSVAKKEEPHFKMPSAVDLPAVTADKPQVAPITTTTTENFAQMAAVEDLLKAVPELLGDTAVLVIKAIAANKIGNVEFLD